MPETNNELSPNQKTIDLDPIQSLLAQIKETYQPLQIWLFGSRARGDARPDSDWDLFVVVPDDTIDTLFDPWVAWGVRRRSGVYADVIPCAISDFYEDLTTTNTLPYAITQEGVLLYER